jgi:hypothetical protein
MLLHSIPRCYKLKHKQNFIINRCLQKSFIMCFHLLLQLSNIATTKIYGWVADTPDVLFGRFGARLSWMIINVCSLSSSRKMWMYCLKTYYYSLLLCISFVIRHYTPPPTRCYVTCKITVVAQTEETPPLILKSAIEHGLNQFHPSPESTTISLRVS